MHKVIAVYQRPDSDSAIQEFEAYYRENHTPICKAIPGLTELRVNRIFGGPTGESNLYMIAEMCFNHKDSWKAAMKTKEMMESGKDAMKFAGKLVSVHFAEETLA